MPEGPSLVILRDLLTPFAGQEIRAAEGTSKLDLERMVGERIVAFRTWGKHLLIEFEAFSMRVHLLMFGTYRINEGKPGREPRMSLRLDSDVINFYACALRYIEGDLDRTYDWHSDVLADAWSPRRARNKLMTRPDTLVCDALLDQDIFAGVGNIIRNDVMYRTRIHPESRIGALPPRKLGELIREARTYSFDFLVWKRAFVLKKHLLAHTKKNCRRCELPLLKTYPGTTGRRSFYCSGCQVRYA